MFRKDTHYIKHIIYLQVLVLLLFPSFIALYFLLIEDLQNLGFGVLECHQEESIEKVMTKFFLLYFSRNLEFFLTRRRLRR